MELYSTAIEVVLLLMMTTTIVTLVAAHPQQFKEFPAINSTTATDLSGRNNDDYPAIVHRIAELAIRKQDQSMKLASSCFRIVRRVIEFEEVYRRTMQQEARTNYNIRMKVCKGNCIVQINHHRPQCVACRLDVSVRGSPSIDTVTIDDLIIAEDKYDDSCRNDLVDVSSSKYEYDKLRAALRPKFFDFIVKYEKTYAGNDTEVERRLAIFQRSVERAELLQRTEKGTAVYGITRFSDLTEDEFRNSFTGAVALPPNYARRNTSNIDFKDIPTEVDWNKAGCVSPVKNQGQCGSCWSFVTTGILESQYAIKHDHKLIQLSEQELVDCDMYDKGCNGGIMQLAFEAIEKRLGGLELENDYPYKEAKQTCTLNKSKIVTTVSKFESIVQDENTMAQYVAQYGPIGSTLYSQPLQDYKGGIMYRDAASCDPKLADHAILVVGYGVETDSHTGQQMPYWLIKNSWGTEWGEDGYLRIYRGTNVCGINGNPSIAFVP